MSGLFLMSFILEICVRKTNSVDSDQTPRSAASDQGLHCLLMALLCEAYMGKHKSGYVS